MAGTTNGFADAHNLRSSAAARAFGDLTQQLNKNEGKIANSAQDAAGSFRNDIEGQKSDALSLVNSAAGVGDMNLPDGVDANTALTGLGDQIGSLTTTAANRAKVIRNPSFSAPNLDISFSTKKPGGMVTA